ncbi:hypothetical protein BU23DRAFT_461613 [Bimuria novae-zelandiae CBS 107.79]|uniref:Cytidyltransferase-like domain-containing protein n=1 Tax=Bimuria novae-zelandiae CBS 107.79 TaxID=1447943 RepID=A0A6A5VBY8_9PLEO|nr:hypothetical protein BU23DRAFT_461613 [Bimuria novae-zelandiae CBS 107.79]
MPPLHCALLLLPPPPSPPTYAALKAAYNAPLLAVLQELRNSAHNHIILDIALPCPDLHGHIHDAREPFYATTQSLVAGLYKLICVIAAKNAINTEDAEGVDPRLILVAYPRNGKLVQSAADSTPEQERQGPVIDLYTLARSPRSWTTIYSVQSEEGEELLKNFTSINNISRHVRRVRGGIVTVHNTHPVDPACIFNSSKHFSVAVGGTFDHMHIGHKLLLTMFAFVLSTTPVPDTQDPRVLVVGITGDELLKKKKYADYLESWHDRQQAVHEFLSSVIYFGQPDDGRIQIQEINEPGPNGHAVHVTYPTGLLVKYVEIWDPFGPTITDESISALVLSLETKSGGNAVNNKRREQGWDELDVFEVSVLDAGEEESVDETFQSKLSSTEIRRRRRERNQSQK